LRRFGWDGVAGGLNFKGMYKRKRGLSQFQVATLVALWCARPVALLAQGYSLDVVGYYNIELSRGDNLIANQLDDGVGNHLADIFPQEVPTGSTFTEWNSTTDSLMPISTYNGSTWSINYALAQDGTGGVFNSPIAATLTVVGTVENFNVETGEYTFAPPARGIGTYLLCTAAALGEVTFQEIVGRDPVASDFVKIWDASTQTYTTTTYNGVSWDNGVPTLNVGQSAYFGLAASTPEPSSLVLIALGAGCWLYHRRRR
jgi:hypothetical protein